MLVNHGVINGAGYDSDVENCVNHLSHIMLPGSLFCVPFSVYLPKLVVRSNIHCLKSMQSTNWVSIRIHSKFIASRNNVAPKKSKC